MHNFHHKNCTNISFKSNYVLQTNFFTQQENFFISPSVYSSIILLIRQINKYLQEENNHQVVSFISKIMEDWKTSQHGLCAILAQKLVGLKGWMMSIPSRLRTWMYTGKIKIPETSHWIPLHVWAVGASRQCLVVKRSPHSPPYYVLHGHKNWNLS